jgi:hypothetical protein
VVVRGLLLGWADVFDELMRSIKVVTDLGIQTFLVDNVNYWEEYFSLKLLQRKLEGPEKSFSPLKFESDSVVFHWLLEHLRCVNYWICGSPPQDHNRIGILQI